MQNIYRMAADLTEMGEIAAIATVINVLDSSPRHIGTKMIIRKDGTIAGSIGGGPVEAAVIEHAKEVIASGKPQMRYFNLRPQKEGDVACGGEMQIFIEPVQPTSSLYIFGAGHIGVSLTRIMKYLDFHTIVIDDRPEFASAERFPDATQVLADSARNIFDRWPMNASSYIVIATRDHKMDEEILETALQTEVKYIGMIGSKTKVKAIFEHLRQKGYTDEQLGRVYTPIGINIGAETSDEIAVSIAAQLIKVRRGTE